MKELILINDIYKKISTRRHLMYLEISYLKLFWKVLYILAMCLLCLSIIGYFYVLIINTSEKYLNFSISFLAILTLFFMTIMDICHRVAFKEYYRNYKKEIIFGWKNYNFLRYLLLKKKLIQQSLYNIVIIRNALENLEIELSELTPESTFKKPLVALSIATIASIGWRIFDKISNSNAYFNYLLISLIALTFFLFGYACIQLQENNRKKKLLELKQHLQRMELDIKRNSAPSD